MRKTRFSLLSTAAVTAAVAVTLTMFPPASFTAYAGDALIKYANQPLNALEKENSPYLKQHARDLVKWSSWNDETLARAKKSGKPIFISVGYSACHWCHVMQAESFNNAEIANLLNDQFVPILIDREQRPDLDEIYLLATEAISGRGGWPNNVFMTPDLKPYYGGIYFPPEEFSKLIGQIAVQWVANKPAVEKEATRIATILTKAFNSKTQAKELSEEVVEKAVAQIVEQYDTFTGGIGTVPKHFNTPTLAFLLQRAAKPGGEEAKEALVSTLMAISKGGVRDHLTGGFHRYAIDNNWRIPHFEKMLYDQAQLAEVFTRTATLTADPYLEKVARSTYDYVLADMTSPQGGFYSNRDADSEGEEGTFYLWSPEQLQKALGQEDADFLLENIGIISEGDFVGQVILHRDTNFDDSDKSRLDKIMAKLAIVRGQRIAPHRDEKIIASWNGLMISSFAVAAQQFNDKRYGAAASKAAQFIWNNMRSPDGDLYRSYYDNQASVTSTLPDYANVAKAFIDVYDLTGQTKWLERAEQMADKIDEKFKDPDAGDYFFAKSTQGYARLKLRADAALPSGNAIALVVAEKLAKRSLDPKHSRRAETLLAALSGDAVSDPVSGATALAAAGRYLRGDTGAMQYAARGRVKVVASLNDQRTLLKVRVKIAPEWHVNADKPFEEDFIPTRLSVRAKNGTEVQGSVTYPQLVSRKLGFQDKPLALFEKEFDLTFALPEPATKTVTSELVVQACNNQLCLLPEMLTLQVTPKLTR